jgi:prevent-host-death family protein
MATLIGAFEAKAQLSRLLRAVERGERFTITVRGKPVADLVPSSARAADASAAAAAAMRAFPRVRGVRDRDVREVVVEGRR